MKKNWTMRIALVVLVLALATACVVSGTMAKYITTDSGTDTATVAKWGVTVTASVVGGFTDTDTGTGVSATAGLIAPGTTGSMTIAITGTPEVASKITFDTTASTQSFTGWDIDGVGTDPNYEPVKWTLNDGATDLVAAGTFAALLAKLDGLSAVENAPGTALAKTYTITWAWAFDGDDAKDTALANLTGAQTLTFAITVSVEQLDTVTTAP